MWSPLGHTSGNALSLAHCHCTVATVIFHVEMGLLLVFTRKTSRLLRSLIFIFSVTYSRRGPYLPILRHCQTIRFSRRLFSRSGAAAAATTADGAFRRIFINNGVPTVLIIDFFRQRVYGICFQSGISKNTAQERHSTQNNTSQQPAYKRSSSCAWAGL